MENDNNRASILLALRSRDLPLAFAMLLLLTVVTVCSMAWLWLSSEGLISARSSMPQEMSTKFRVDINQATSPEIANLPKVGPSLAGAIVDYRESHGPFASLAELTNVSGIGEKKLAAITPYLSPLSSGHEVASQSDSAPSSDPEL